MRFYSVRVLFRAVLYRSTTNPP
uniref:Uncharacterized protein n=1 Tax=Caenorhabditis japonica TaxID=281687 RepID=A0A8R1E8B9_CAEJA